MMAFGGQAWSGFWDPVQYTGYVFFFLFAICSLLLAFLPFCLPFSYFALCRALCRRPGSSILSPFSLSASSGLSSLLTPSYTSFNALLLCLTLAMTG